MASAALFRPLEDLRSRPLRGLPLAALTILVWVAGALYCSGYEALSTGIDNWPGSLIWSAVAVLPWLALFEWSKSPTGRRLTAPPMNLALLLCATAAGSLALQGATDLITGSGSAPLALSLLRRLPAIGASLLLILWSRGAVRRAQADDENLASIAQIIEWIAAADNYVELHFADRVAMRRMTMREAEQALARRGFVRIHRRYLVNRQRIASVSGNGDQIVRLTNGTELPVGRRYATNVASLP